MADPLPSPPPNPTILPQELWNRVGELLGAHFQYSVDDDPKAGKFLNVLLYQGRSIQRLTAVRYARSSRWSVPSREAIEGWFRSCVPGRETSKFMIGGHTDMYFRIVKGGSITWVEWCDIWGVILSLNCIPENVALLQSLAERICHFLNE